MINLPDEAKDWSEDEQKAYIAAMTAACEEEAALAEDLENLDGTPAQRAIADAKKRTEEAKRERMRLQREKVDREARIKLRAQYGEHGVVFFPSKEGMIAMRVPSDKEQADHGARVKAMPREDDKRKTNSDFNRGLVVHPAKARFDEIAKKYPLIEQEVIEFLNSEMSARDYSARPYD